MEQIYSHLAARKVKIEKEFTRLNVKGVSLKVTPRLPEFLDINITSGKLHTKFKTIHFMEKTHLREMLKFHGVL
jgi:hypothetical protein